MAQLSKITRIEDLRIVWKHEARDFSKWLAEEDNLLELSNTIGITITSVELESNVGSFSVDLYATEEGTNRKIIIENQLEDTNHDHLGKIITYAAGKTAEVIIWIVKKARDEHKQAIEWLNQHTDENIGFFLIELELWKIEDSLPAPKFNVIERPNEWAKNMKNSEGLSEIRRLEFEFWQSFNNYAFLKQEFSKQFSKRKPKPQHWYDLSVGSSEYHIGMTVNTQKKRIGTEIYINENKNVFEKFREKQKEIESELGITLDWIEAEKACRILALHQADIKSGFEHWNSMFDWLCEMSIKLKTIILKYSNMD